MSVPSLPSLHLCHYELNHVPAKDIEVLAPRPAKITLFRYTVSADNQVMMKLLEGPSSNMLGVLIKGDI